MKQYATHCMTKLLTVRPDRPDSIPEISGDNVTRIQMILDDSPVEKKDKMYAIWLKAVAGILDKFNINSGYSLKTDETIWADRYMAGYSPVDAVKIQVKHDLDKLNTTE